ncbi:MAG: FAD-dependent monooxygenase [Leptospiraceae bacterium]|nr:FAD-dependent monooxygenase [Leptospiraceae bacterium]
MKKNLSAKVLIIGAGPTGMTASLALSKLGISNIIIEKRDKLSPHPKAHELSSRSLEILDWIGVKFNELKKEASDFETATKILFCNTFHEEIGRIDLTQTGTIDKYKEHVSFPEPFLNISQVEIERILRKHLVSAKNVQFLEKFELNSFQQKESSVLTSITRSNDSEMFQVQSDYVICSDGATSKSRSLLGIKMIGPEKLSDFANIYFKNDLTKIIPTKAKLYWMLNPEIPGVFIAHKPEKRWVYHIPVQTPYEKIEDFTKEVFIDRVKKALGDNDIEIDFGSISSWRMTAQIADRFRIGSIFLSGDSCHRFPPTGGLGMNSGIADAHNLAWKLAFVINKLASEKLLETYETERRPVVEKNCAESLKNSVDITEVPKSFGLNPDLGKYPPMIINSFPMKFFPVSWKKKLNDFLINKVKNISKSNRENPTKQKMIQDTIANQLDHFDRIGLDLGFCYRSSAILSSEPIEKTITSIYNANTDPGKRFPHFWIDSQKKVSSFSLLSKDKFTLIDFSKSKFIPKLEFKKIIEHSSLFSFKKDKSYLLEKLQITETGFLLIRPDGIIAHRKKFISKLENITKEVEDSLRKILSISSL